MNTTVKTKSAEKSLSLLIVSAVLLLAALLFSTYAHQTSYQSSLTADDDVRLALQRPYAYGLVAVFLSGAMLLKGICNAVIGVSPRQRADVRKMAMAGLMAALCYIGFAFFKIPLGPGMPAFHFGNVFCVLAALLLGGYWGGLAGAVGMTVADLTTAYVTSAPKTFLLKLCIGLVTGLVAHIICKLDQDHSFRYVTGVTIVSCTCGMAFNVVAEPIAGYFYKTYLLGIPQDLAATLAKMSAVTSFVNAVIAVIAATVFYLALRPALRKAGLL